MKKLNVLIACEESQAVCKAFRELGHEAYSCDIQECSGGYPEWHIQANCLPLLNGNCEFITMDGKTRNIYGHWDLIIAHPPCTKTSNADARHLYKNHQLNLQRFYEGLCGKALIQAIWYADCLRVVIESPLPSKIFNFPEPTQIIQPYEYGHPMSKKTCLWIRGLPLLIPTKIVTPFENCHEPYSWFSTGGKDRQKNRSKTFTGIALAMAKQWSDYINKECIK